MNTRPEGTKEKGHCYFCPICHKKFKGRKIMQHQYKGHEKETKEFKRLIKGHENLLNEMGKM